MFRSLDRHRAHEHRLPVGVAPDDVVDDGVELGVLGLIDEVRLVGAGDRPVRRDLDHLEVVDLLELTGLGHRRAGHATELVVLPEVVLQRDRGQRLVLLLDPDALLGLDGLVQSFGVAAALEDAPGELVDDLHLAVVDEVVDVALIELLGSQPDVEVMDEIDVGVVVHVVDAEDLLDPRHPVFGGHHLAFGLVDLVVLVTAEPFHDPGEVPVPLGGVGDPAADDEGRTGLVDEDGVDLVHDGVGMAALHQVGRLHGHVVPQVVEPELVVRAVGDVGGVGRNPLLRLHVRLDESDLQAEEAVDSAHPLGVAFGQVVVHRDDVDALSTKGVEVGRHRGDERLALAGAHLGDLAAVQGPGTDHLDVVMALTEHPLGGLAHDGEGLRFEVVERLPVVESGPELVRPGAKFGVGERLDGRLERVDSLDQSLEGLE
jgi:hypothetical protein